MKFCQVNSGDRLRLTSFLIEIVVSNYQKFYSNYYLKVLKFYNKNQLNVKNV